MVDIRDIESLEDHQRNTSVPDEVIMWARQHSLPTYMKMDTIKSLYNRYKGQPEHLIQKMIRSKTGLNDKERLVHEEAIRLYPYWSYEVNTPIGSVDFLSEDMIMEFKHTSAWKQVVVLLLYAKYFPYHDMVAVFFGTRFSEHKERIVTVALNDLGIHCYYWTKDGLEIFTLDSVPEEF